MHRTALSKFLSALCPKALELFPGFISSDVSFINNLGGIGHILFYTFVFLRSNGDKVILYNLYAMRVIKSYFS